MYQHFVPFFGDADKGGGNKGERLGEEEDFPGASVAAEKENNTPSFLYSMEKAKKDFGFIPKYTDYMEMMKDYKKELESGRWEVLVDSGNKVAK